MKSTRGAPSLAGRIAGDVPRWVQHELQFHSLVYLNAKGDVLEVARTRLEEALHAEASGQALVLWVRESERYAGSHAAQRWILVRGRDTGLPWPRERKIEMRAHHLEDLALLEPRFREEGFSRLEEAALWRRLEAMSERIQAQQARTARALREAANLLRTGTLKPELLEGLAREVGQATENLLAGNSPRAGRG